jgi:TonB family protein
LGRPPVDAAPAAAHAEAVEPRTRDSVDSELLAARMVQALADTSRRAGPERGDGRGGVGGGGAPGSGGGSGEGGHARAYGPGSGDHDALDTRDERYQRWFLAQRRAVERNLVFPRERMLAMDQGSVVYRLVVRADGTLDGDLVLLRSSGFDDLDRAARAAIERTLPLSRVPPELLAGRTSLRVAMPVHFVNPMTH